MDIDKQTNNVKKASGFFDELNAFIKKHPVWFVIILLIGLAYWGSTIPDEPIDHTAVDAAYYEEYGEDALYEETYVEEDVNPVQEHTSEDYTVTKKTFFVDTVYRYGDTVYVDYYSDGYKEKYYKNDWTNYGE